MAADILAEAAGISAGSWYANPATHVGHELIAAGMMILAGGSRVVPLDYGELERWTRVDTSGERDHVKRAVSRYTEVNCVAFTIPEA
jgi:hypothetical protein